MPDHSLVQWEVVVGSIGVKVEEEGQQVRKMRKIVPEIYRQKEEEKSEIKALTSRVMQCGANQEEIDDVYEKWRSGVCLKYQGRNVRGDNHDSQKSWQNWGRSFMIQRRDG